MTTKTSFVLQIDEARPMFRQGEPKRYASGQVMMKDGEPVYNWILVGWLVSFNSGHIVRYSLAHNTISVEEPGVPVKYKSGRVVEGEFEKTKRVTGYTEAKFRKAYSHSSIVELSLLGFRLAELEYQERFA